MTATQWCIQKVGRRPIRILTAIACAGAALGLASVGSAEASNDRSADAPLPSWSAQARSASTVPLGTAVVANAPSLARAPRESAVALEKYGFVEEEYFISGNASSGGETRAPVPYTTRVLIRRPRNADDFFGSIFLEPFSEATEEAPVWRSVWPFIVQPYAPGAAAHVWVGITVSAGNVDKVLKRFDRSRYEKLKIADDQQQWDILAQVALLLQNPAGPLGKLGLLRQGDKVQGRIKVYSVGWRQTGCLQTAFINNGHHARARTPQGRPAISGYLAGACPEAGPIKEPADAAVMQVLTESAYRADVDRLGAIRATRDGYAQKAGKSLGQSPVFSALENTPTPQDQFAYVATPRANRFRYYELAGVSDLGYLDQPQFSITAFQIGQKSASPPSCANPLSTLPGRAPFLRAILMNMDHWMRQNLLPPPNKFFVLSKDHSIERDTHGNARGGMRPHWVEVPTSTFVSSSNSPGTQSEFCGDAGHEVRFSATQMKELYPGNADYIAKVERLLDGQARGAEEKTWGMTLMESDAMAERARVARSGVR